MATKPTSRREFLRKGITASAAAALASAAAVPSGAMPAPERIGKPRFKVGCCAYSYRQRLQGASYTLLDFLETCADLNLDGVELTSYYFPRSITPAYLNKLSHRAFLLGLEVAGTAVGNRFTVPPGPERDKQIALVKQWIRYSADLGAHCLRVFAGELPGGVDVPTGRKWVIECLEACLPTAAENGVILAMENHHGVVNDGALTLAILNAISSEWFGLKWDCANYQTRDPFVDLAETAPYAVTTHVKTEMAPSGRKQPADLSRVLSLLRAVNYRGYLFLEYEAAEDATTAVPKALAAIQKVAAI